MIHTRVLGIPTEVPSLPYGVMEIWIRDQNNLPIPNCPVELRISSPCEQMLCVCPYPLSGTTDQRGYVQIRIRLGGCCYVAPAAWLIADDVTIRTYPAIVSPDYDGTAGDCRVGLPDFAYFAHQYQTVAGCSDYDGDGMCGITDFVTFNLASWRRYCTPR